MEINQANNCDYRGADCAKFDNQVCLSSKAIGRLIILRASWRRWELYEID